MSLNDQENYDQPTKRRKKANSTKPFALSQPTAIALSQPSMDTSLTPVKPTKRLSSVQVDSVSAKRPRSQSNQFTVYSGDDEESSKFGNSSAGVVKSVKLINFMCHSHFEIKLNPRINFISGCNGSGKSAIQTALVIGLGGVASKTNRSSKIDGLIKHGCHSGSVTIILSNTGHNAYKPEEYGRTIQIVRNINQSSASYKIYNQWNKLMATTKKELDNICTRFRIQPNNPVAVLNQDMARNFLSSNKAEDKYSLFRKATLLDEAEALLKKIADDVFEHENQLESKKRAIAQIQEEIGKMSKKIKLIEGLRASKQKKFELENELAWSKVNSCRDDFNHLTERRSEQERMKNNLLQQLNNLQDEENDLNSKIRKYEGDIASIQDECRTIEETRLRLADKFKNLKNSYQMKCMACDEVESKVKARKKDCAELKTNLDDTQRMELESKKKKEEALGQISTLQDELDVNESKKTVLESEMNRLKATTDSFADEMDNHRRKIQDISHYIGNCERQIKSLKNESDTLSMYEPWMSTLVQKINEAVKNNKFSKPPRGPLGRYIKVKHENWMYAIETNLSLGFLSSFLVNSSNDRRVLYSIMDQVIRSGHKPSINCTTFQEGKRDAQLRDLETSHRDYFNMFRALNVNDVVVSNFLMDYKNIQRILLVGKDEDCRNFVKDNRNLPRKCQLILNENADQFLPGYKVYANFKTRGRTRILCKSAVDQLRGLQEEVLEKRETISQMNSDMESIQVQYNEKRNQMREISREIEKLKKSVFDSKREIRNLKYYVEMETPSLQMKIDEINEIEEELRRLEEQKEKLITERAKAHEEMMDAKKRMSAESSNDTMSVQTQLNLDKDKISRQLSALNIKISNLRKQIAEQDQKLSNLDSRIKESEEKLATEETAASQLTSEEAVQQPRSVREVQKLLRDVVIYIEDTKKKIGDDDKELEKNFYEKKKVSHDIVKHFKEIMELCTKLKSMHADRKIIVGHLRDVNASIIMAKFQDVLKSRNYKGDLKFDHNNRKLDIMMAPIDGGKNLNTSSLSGGEKSYSTVAFLLALWSPMDIPFYSMDEYDVFMDAINRKTITELLMAYAKSAENRQFIFLTPLDVSIIKIGPNVHVHKINKIQG